MTTDSGGLCGPSKVGFLSGLGAGPHHYGDTSQTLLFVFYDNDILRKFLKVLFRPWKSKVTVKMGCPQKLLHNWERMSGLRAAREKVPGSIGE